MFADIFTSLEGIWRAFKQVKCRKANKNISRYFKKRHFIIHLLTKVENFYPLSPSLMGHNKDFPKSKNLHESLQTEHFREYFFFWGGGGVKIQRDKLFRPMRIFAFAIKLSRSGENSQDGVKIYQRESKCVGSNSWHLAIKFSVLAYLKFHFVWP